MFSPVASEDDFYPRFAIYGLLTVIGTFPSLLLSPWSPHYYDLLPHLGLSYRTLTCLQVIYISIFQTSLVWVIHQLPILFFIVFRICSSFPITFPLWSFFRIGGYVRIRTSYSDYFSIAPRPISFLSLTDLALVLSLIISDWFLKDFPWSSSIVLTLYTQTWSWLFIFNSLAMIFFFATTRTFPCWVLLNLHYLCVRFWWFPQASW